MSAPVDPGGASSRAEETGNQPPPSRPEVEQAPPDGEPSLGGLPWSNPSPTTDAARFETESEPERERESTVVYGSGERHAWGRRDGALAIWRLADPGTVVESFPPHQRAQALQRFVAREHGPAERRSIPTHRIQSWWPPRSSVAAWSVAVALIGLVVYLTAAHVVGKNPSSQGLGLEEPSTSAGRPSSAIPDATGQPTTASSLPGVNLHVNDRAGYLFSYPDGWDLSQSGGKSELVSPGGDVEMSFGPAPSGSLRPASDRVVELLTAGYRGVKLLPAKAERTMQGARALVVGATATDSNGAFTRFLAITIQGPDQNRAITVRFSAGSDPLDALPTIREIVASFRISEQA